MSSPTRYDLCPWLFWKSATEEEQSAQLELQHRLAEGADVKLGERVFISPYAGVLPRRLVVGDDSYLAAHTYVTDEVTMGAHSTLNPYATARGNVRVGDGVRIGAHSSLLGFNHSFEPDRPVYQQPVTSRGIVVGDDVWIGSHAVVLDGVSVGSHAVIGAGAVVTKDVPAWAVVAGNPARVIRDRRVARRPANADLTGRLEAFAEHARSDVGAVLARCWEDDGADGRFVDRPGAAPTVRAWCDAVEIADLLTGSTPPQAPASSLVPFLQSMQDPATGLVPEIGGGPPSVTEGPAPYHILAVGYALDLLGARFPHPISAVSDIDSDALVARLERLPWHDTVWSAGGWIDCFATGLYRNLADFQTPGTIDTLLGWLLLNADRWHGMWGRPTDRFGWQQVVNGFYRLTRGTFAQFGVPLPYPDTAIDTVLRHVRDERYFGDHRGTACDVLDVVHPLWLAGKQTDHRRAEVQAWARWQLDRVLIRWQDGAGFSFALESGSDPARTPGLQGTEMWLAIVWLLADLVGDSEALGYRPRGVHRPEPAPRPR
jgi:acetyltransferase-like isoleucine patch superfamily enzyme